MHDDVFHCRMDDRGWNVGDTVYAELPYGETHGKKEFLVLGKCTHDDCPKDIPPGYCMLDYRRKTS